MENPYASPEIPSPGFAALDDTLTEGTIFKAWLGFIIFSSICGFFAGILVGAILGAVLGAAGSSLQTVRIVCTLAGFIIGLPISYAFYRRSVKKLFDSLRRQPY